ncbi:MAG: type II CAAX endopeptidase family protein [Gemmatimonadota bacterium]|jgi:membrane protease YdiL (CAAX protease family)
MIPGPRRPDVRFTARFLLVTLAFGLPALATAGSEAADMDMSPTTYVVGFVVLGWLLFGAYEVLAWGTTALLGRMVGPAESRAERQARARRPTVFTPFRALLVLVTYIAGTGVAAWGLVLLVEALGGKVESGTLATGRYSWIILASLVLGAAAAWGAFRGFARPRDRVRMRRLRRSPGARIVRATVLGAMVFALFVSFVLPFLLPISESYEPGTVSRMAAAAGWPRLWLAAIAVLVAPPVEETLFRGVLLEGLLRRISRFDAILLTTLLFGVGHLPDILGNWPAVTAILGGGWILAELRLRTRSLVPGVAAHMAYNGVLMALTLL